MSNKLEFSRGEVIAEKYEVVDRLDETPLGITYRTKHLKTSKYVRLVLLRPKIAGREQKDKIVDAFKNSKALNHPHLVKMGELGENEGVAYFTYEDFEGSTLRELMQEYKVAGKRLALKEAAQICMQILEGLGELHKNHVVVRGVRPEYVLVNVRYTGPRKQTFVAQTKVVGSAFWDLVPTAVLAEEEFTAGEAQYLAPELKSFEPTPTPRCDVYSVAVIFYELLVGTAPVGTFQDPKALRPDLPDHVNTVAELGLANAPDDRYPSTADFINDLQRTFQDVNLDEGRSGGRSLVMPIALGLALVAVFFLAVILFNFRPDPELVAQAADSQDRSQVLEKLQASAPSKSEFESIYAKHPKNMVYIPPGPYVAGRLRSPTTDGFAGSSEPVSEVRETKGFLIDVFEYPDLVGQPPVFDVTFEQAEQRCKEAGKRLCTSDEWERACKGPRSQVYSYGDTFDQDFCGRGLETPYASGAMGDCKSGWGVYDMSGSFREWTSTEEKKGRAVVKGGEKGAPERGTRCAAGTDESVNFADKTLSFRCCRDVDAPPPAPAP